MTTPQVTKMSATLKTGKSMKAVAKKSVTCPATTRSMRLPMPPPHTAPRAQASGSPIERSRTTQTVQPTQMTAASSTKTQVEPEPMEKAAPVFITSERSSTPGMKGSGPAASASLAQALVTWSRTAAQAASPA